MTKYIIPINNLDERIEIADRSFHVIKRATLEYHKLLVKNISKFSKSGALRASWKIEIYDDYNASVYSPLPYARIQDRGGKIKVTKRMRGKFWVLYRKTRSKKYKYMAISKKKTFKIPAKYYSKVDLNKVRRVVEREFAI